MPLSLSCSTLIKNMISVCAECHQVLTDEEIEYYKTRCEQCEREWLDDIEAWRDGAENKKFDAMYGDKKPVLN